MLTRDEKHDALKEQLGCGHSTAPLVDYFDEKPAGWCWVAPRVDQPRLTKTNVVTRESAKPLDNGSVSAVMCFDVRRVYRGTGIARALLHTFVNLARWTGPRRGGKPDRMRIHALDRGILNLALPTLDTLVAEPLLLLVDTALVGHLGGVPLAALGIASVVLQTAVGLLVFLADATTPIIARLLGSRDHRAAGQAGVDGAWLALAVGAVLLVVGLVFAPAAVAAFAPAADVSAAVSYLAISSWSLPARLFVHAADGLLRGLQDTRTPLLIAAVGFTVTAGLDAS